MPTQNNTQHVSSETPELFGRYRIIETQATGGFGTVLVAWDVRLQRRVAIKRIPLDANGENTAHFEEALAEARASSFLTNAHIVNLHDFLADDAYCYLVMEYVDGCSLEELLARLDGHTLIYDEVAYVCGSICKALAYAHQNGVLHLDLKPANILIDSLGNVKLADFGMASLMSAAGFEDARGGTLGYMAPEQIAGEMVDERSDIFSLACVMYEAMLGRAPFGGKTVDASLAAIAKGAPEAKTVEAEVPEAVSEALAQALSYDADERMSSVEAFMDEAVRELGDAEAGHESLREIMAEAADDSFEEDEWRSLDTFATRHPVATHVGTLACNALTAAIVAGGALTGLATGGIIAPWVALVCAFGLGAFSLKFPAFCGASALCVLAFVFGVINYSEVGILLSIVLGASACIWAGTCTYRVPLASGVLLLPVSLVSPAWTPGAFALIYREAHIGALAGAVSSFASWMAFAFYSGFDGVFVSAWPAVLLWIAASAIGASASIFVARHHPYVAQVAATVCMLAGILVSQNICASESFAFFASIQTLLLLISLVLMFVLVWQFERKTTNAGNEQA